LDLAAARVRAALLKIVITGWMIEDLTACYALNKEKGQCWDVLFYNQTSELNVSLHLEAQMTWENNRDNIYTSGTQQQPWSLDKDIFLTPGIWTFEHSK
jgi:hypothetical protein